MTTKFAQAVQEQCEHTIVNMTDNTTTVYTGSCYLIAIHVNIVLTAAAVDIENVAGTPVFTLAASLAASTNLPFYGTHFPNALIINPDDGAASGQITVMWRKHNPDSVDALTVITPAS